MDFDSTKNNTENLNTSDRTDFSKVVFDNVSSPFEKIAETEALEKDFEKMLDSRRLEVLKDYRDSDEFSEKKKDLSDFVFGEVAELHIDKQEYLAECTDEYKKEWINSKDDSDADLTDVQQKWENALKDCDVCSAVLEEKREDQEEKKESSFGKTAAAVALSLLTTFSTPEHMESAGAWADAKGIEEEQKDGENKNSLFEEKKIADGGPNPEPEKNSMEINGDVSYAADYQLFDQPTDYSQNVSVTYDASSIEEQQEKTEFSNTPDHKHLDRGYDYFDKIASSNGEFITMPSREFSNDESLKSQENPTLDNMKNAPTELSDEKIDEIIASGDSVEKREVQPGEKFIRIGGETDSGTSPYFTNSEQIKDISFVDDNGELHLDEDSFRERFGVPENSSLEVCRVYETVKDGTIYSSTVAETVEHWGAVKHHGGGEQYLILNRDHLIDPEPEKLKVHTHSTEEFEKLLNDK